MGISIVPHEEKHRSSVEDFNSRMRAGGSKWGFYTDPRPDWIPKFDEAPTWREYHLAVEEDGTVRGGYALKPQRWLIDGEIEWVTDWQGPFTEAAIDPRYSTLMLKCLRTMQREHPLLFSLGHGGTEEPIVELLKKMNWHLWPVPFCLRVFKPFKFLRRNRYLRGTPMRRLALDLIAFSGFGAIGLWAIQSWSRLGVTTRKGSATASEVPEFGSWADELWQAHGEEYACAAVRDRAMMNALLPPTGWPGGTRLRIDAGGEVVGWSVVNIKNLDDDPRFGSLRVGLLTDCFASPAKASEVAAATVDYLKASGVDLAFANICHPEWVKALKGSGFIVLPNRRIFAVSPQLNEKLQPESKFRDGLHLTNMDGHGPHGFDVR
ncbi:MAG: hypothetical protein RIE74_12115 [Pseudomonadales bacterium]